MDLVYNSQTILFIGRSLIESLKNINSIIFSVTTDRNSSITHIIVLNRFDASLFRQSACSFSRGSLASILDFSYSLNDLTTLLKIS